jgi:hypothetical protein
VGIGERAQVHLIASAPIAAGETIGVVCVPEVRRGGAVRLLVECDERVAVWRGELVPWLEDPALRPSGQPWRRAASQGAQGVVPAAGMEAAP